MGAGEWDAMVVGGQKVLVSESEAKGRWCRNCSTGSVARTSAR